MKYGSYVATGHKFGLMSKPGFDVHIRNAIQKIEKNDEKNIPGRDDIELKTPFYSELVVPFEDVDGLSIDELADYDFLLYQDRYLVFVMYDALCEKTLEQSFEGTTYNKIFTEKKTAYVRYIYLIDTMKTKERNCSIDEVIENHLISRIDQLSYQNRRRAVDFIEKYVRQNARSVDYLVKASYFKSDSYSLANEILQFEDRLVYKNHKK